MTLSHKETCKSGRSHDWTGILSSKDPTKWVCDECGALISFIMSEAEAMAVTRELDKPTPTHWMRLNTPFATIGLRVRDNVVVSVPVEHDWWLLGCPIDALAEFAARRGWTLENVPAFWETHRCWKCQDGQKPCPAGHYRQCEYPRARND